MRRFDEAALEQIVVDRLAENGFVYVQGDDIDRDLHDVLIRDDLFAYLKARYPELTEAERARFVKTLDNFSAGESALYDSNRDILRRVSDGVVFHRDDPADKDVLLRLVDYDAPDKNLFKVVNQFTIQGASETRRPDVIVFVNGLPLVVMELKTPVNEDVTIESAFTQLTVRYRRDIPELYKYNAFVVVSDGVNTKAGSVFADLNNFYPWRGTEKEADGVKALYAMLDELFERKTLLDVLRDFIYFPDKSGKALKIVCRSPQYYATNKLYDNILKHVRIGDGKGGTYFGATGCGKSFTMLFLCRKLMRSSELNNPTILIISDRIDLDDQLSEQFLNAKKFINDDAIVQIENRDLLGQNLRGRESGGLFLTTVQKFAESTGLLSDRRNIIVISDEAHRSQVNIEKKIKVSEKGVEDRFGFAYFLRQSLPNATYVGFTGTPVDATLDVFGDVVETYTMTQAVNDGITVRIVYEGRAAKVFADREKLALIEKYYEECEEAGANEYQIEESKKKAATIKSVLGHPDRLRAVAQDFVAHYEARVAENATVAGKAMFVCADREIAYAFYKAVIALRPDWAVAKESDENAVLTEADKRDLKPMEKIKLVMTYNKDDEPALFAMLKKDDKEELARQFKNIKSNFKIAIVVDMWLTGFDVPALDTMYLDKYVRKHTLIQTISRVNRVYDGKEKGLVVDYIGIQRALTEAVGTYGAGGQNGAPIDNGEAVSIVKDELDLLNKMFHTFDSSRYFNGTGRERLDCLNDAAEFALQTEELMRRFMKRVKRLKSAFNLCLMSEKISTAERDLIHFYIAVRSIIFKMTKGDAPDVSEMNAHVRQMVEDALVSSDVEDIFQLSEKGCSIDLFSEEYLERVLALKRPNTRVQILERLLKNAVSAFREVNKIKAVDFAQKLNGILERYNDRTDKVDLNEIVDEMIDLIYEMRAEQNSFAALGIDFEEKAFYDILKSCAVKYGFDYPEDKTIFLAKEIKRLVDDKTHYTNWAKKASIRAAMQADLIVLLDDNGYPPEPQSDVYKNVIEQAENFKKYQIM